MKHLSFNEIVDAIYTKELTPESARHIARVNAHVMSCPDCFKIHKAVYEIYELGFEQGLDVVNERLQDLKDRYHCIKESSTYNINKKYIAQIVIGIKNKKIEMNAVDSFSILKNNYSYPINTKINENKQLVDISTIIDKEKLNDLIRIDNDKLIIQLNKKWFDIIDVKYPYVEVSAENGILYEGFLDEKNDLFEKIVETNNNKELCVNIFIGEKNHEN